MFILHPRFNISQPCRQNKSYLHFLKKDLSLCADLKHYPLWVRANWVIICVSEMLLLCLYHSIYYMCLFNFQIPILNFIEFKMGYILALKSFIVICSRESMFVQLSFKQLPGDSYEDPSTRNVQTWGQEKQHHLGVKLQMQNGQLLSRPTESQCVFSQDPQAISVKF